MQRNLFLFQDEIIWKIIPDKCLPFIAIQTRHKGKQHSHFYRYSITKNEIDLSFKNLPENFNLELQEMGNGHLILHRFNSENPVLANNILCLSDKEEKILWESYRHKLKKIHPLAIEVFDVKTGNSKNIYLKYPTGEAIQPNEDNEKEAVINELDAIEMEEIDWRGEKIVGNLLFAEQNNIKILVQLNQGSLDNSIQLFIQKDTQEILNEKIINADLNLVFFRMINNTLMLIKNQSELVIFSI